MKKEQGASATDVASKGNKQKLEEAKIAKEGKAAKTAKKSTKSSEGRKAEKVTVKREKKLYELPGQTRESPDEVGPLRSQNSWLTITRSACKIYRPDVQ